MAARKKPRRLGRRPTHNVLPGLLEPELVAVAALTLDPRNARTHPARTIADLETSLRQFGQHRPLVVQKAGMVVRAGNALLQAARNLGWTHVGALVVDETDPQAIARAIADNRTAEHSGWDETVLAELLGELAADDGLLQAAGFAADEVEGILERGELPEPDPPAPRRAFRDGHAIGHEVAQRDLPSKPRTRRGDLWLCGPHRLLCGSATDAGDVARATGGERAVLCLTDPPYSVDYGESHKSRGGDPGAFTDDQPPAEVLPFMALVPADVMLWFYPVYRHLRAVSEAYEMHGWVLRKELVWVRDRFSFWPSAVYQQRHEMIGLVTRRGEMAMLTTRNGKAIGGNVPANVTTVLEHAMPRAHQHHPTAKPIRLFAELLAYHTDPGDLVFDPFLGSGTTLLAAEQLGRRCAALELAPHYVDVAVQRWQEFTGDKAIREGARTPPKKKKARRAGGKR